MIGAILKAREARVANCPIFDRRVAAHGGGAVRRWHGKCLLTKEVEAAENTNKDKTARHKKVRVMTLIPC